MRMPVFSALIVLLLIAACSAPPADIKAPASGGNTGPAQETQSADFGEDTFPPPGIGLQTRPLGIGEGFTEYGGGASDEFVADVLMRYTIGFGHSFYSDRKYKTFAEDVARSRVISSGINQERLIKIHLQGDLDERVSILIHYDSTEDESEQIYLVQYRALSDDEFLQRATIGNVLIKLESSKYAMYDNTGKRGLGFDTLFHFNRKLAVRAFGTVYQSQSESETFRGSSTKDSISLAEYQYTKNKYFQIEPYIRYDNASSPPSLSAALYDNSVALSSSEALAGGESFRAHSVNISPSSFALYMDDRKSDKSSRLYTLSIDGQSYRKLTAGSDYSINYVTGEIEMRCAVSASARIFCVYSLKERRSADMSVRTDIFDGRNFVFIKYASLLDEDANRDGVWDGDRNGDGVVNLDVYERRGVFDSGASSWAEEGFVMNVFRDRKVLNGSERSALGPCTIDYKNARVVYALREPFRSLLGKNAAKLYSPVLSAESYRYSRYTLSIGYYAKGRTYQLKQMNIVEGSVVVRIDGRLISDSLYKVDYANGVLEFTSSQNPFIGENSNVVIDYDYAPLGAAENAFVGGVRTDYRINRHLLVGSTVLFAGGAQAVTVPDAGSESRTILVGEADSTVWLGSSTLSKAATVMRGKRTEIPFDFTAYGEVAASSLNVNTFGSAMVDAMENSEEVVPVDLSDSEWMLSSMPSGYTQSQRAPLKYKFYCKKNDTDSLQGISFTPYEINYATKSGPYNIKEKYLPKEESEALVFDFDFTNGDAYCGAVTRSLSNEAVDFSGLQYLEVWYRAEGTGSVSLSFDVGSLNEDSDGDSTLDTEDTNHNGYLDYDPSTGLFEDRGYRFNPSGEDETRVGGGARITSDTKGDGRLTAEDLNKNGVLDTAESFLRIPGTASGTRSFVGSNTSLTRLDINLARPGWKKAVLYVDRDSLETSGLSGTLKTSTAMRINIENNGSAAGRIHIGSVKCIASSWKDIEVNNVPDESGENFRVDLVNTQNDSEYRSNSFAKKKHDIYSSLYGEIDSGEDIYEGALALTYTSLAGSTGSVVKIFARSIDLIQYRTLKLWLNVREYSPGDTLTFQIGSSERDYLSYEIPLDKANGWFETKMTLSESGADSVEGSPDLSRVQCIRVAVTGSSGRLWLNNILVSNARDVTGLAYWAEGSINSKRALYYDEKREAMTDTTFKYANHGRQRSFNSPGLEVRDMSEFTHELYASSWIFSNLYTGGSFISRRTATSPYREDISEELWGTGLTRSGVAEIRYVDAKKWPSVSMIYQLDNYTNHREELIDELALALQTERSDHNGRISMTHNADFDFVQLNSLLSTDLLFSDEHKEWSRAQGLEYYGTPKRSRYQKSTTTAAEELLFDHIYFSPAITFANAEYITRRGYGDSQTDISGDLTGSWHMPWFFDGRESKYFMRRGDAAFSWGVREFSLCNPVHDITFARSESDFADSDRSSSLFKSGYLRTHDALSDLTQQITIPFKFDDNIFRLETITFTWSRALHLDETAIPYEGETRNFFNERYGVSRITSPAAETMFNFYRYSPWVFFTGRGNYANGRDHLIDFLNSPVSVDGSENEDYSNGVSLGDTFTKNTYFDFGTFNLLVNANLSQLSERSALELTPSQMVTFGAGGQLAFDLMRIFRFGPLPLAESEAGTLTDTRSALLTTGYNYARNMFITSNIAEDQHTPSLSISLGIDRKMLTIGGSVDLRLRKNHQYISEDDSERSDSDDIYYENLPGEKIDEFDRSYSFKIEYMTDLPPLYSLFAMMYELHDQPMLTLSYEFLFNRYDYIYTVSPEPYDMHLVTGILDLDIHKNIKGGITGRWALEKIHNRETGNVYKEIISYEVLFGLTLLY